MEDAQAAESSPSVTQLTVRESRQSDSRLMCISIRRWQALKVPAKTLVLGPRSLDNGADIEMILGGRPKTSDPDGPFGRRRAGRSILIGLGASLSLLLAACGSTPSNMEDRAAAVATITAVESVTPLPPGSSFDQELLEPQPGEVYEVGFWNNMVQGQAQCKWYMYWLAAHATRDQTKISAALEMFTTMHGWHLYTSADVSFRQLVDRVESQAELGDSAGLENFVRLNCVNVRP